MQSLHRGSFCVQDGEKPGEGSDVYLSRCSSRNPSGSLELLALSAHRLSQGTLGYISEDPLGSAQKALASTYRRIFG